MSTKTLVYNADTAAFMRNMEGARQSLLATGDASDKAKAKILENAQQQIKAALELGKSQETLDRITQQAAASMAAVTEKNSARIEAALDRQMAKARATAVEMEKLGRVKVNDGAGHGFSDRMATSTVIRGAEGTASIRGIEATLSMFPAAMQAAQALAPLIGAAGLAGLVVELGVKATEAVEKIHKIPEAIADGWQGVNQPLIEEADNLRKANAELDVSIAMLEHKVPNTLAVEIAETRVEVDKLASSSIKARGEIEKLLKQNSTTGIANMFLSDQLSTGPAEDEIKKRMKAQRDAAVALQDDTESGKLTPEQIATRRAAIVKQYRDDAAWARETRLGIRSFDPTDKQTGGVINDLIGFQQYATSTADVSDLSTQNVDKQKQKKDLEDQKKLGTEQVEAGRKAAEARLHSMEEFVNEWKIQGNAGAKAIFDYWEVEKSSFAKGSTEFNAIVAKQATLAEEGARKAAEAIAKFKASQRDHLELPNTGGNVFGNTADSGRELARAYGKSSLSGDEVTAAIQKERVEIDLANGSISKYTATQRLAGIEAELHAARIRDLNTQIDELKSKAGAGYDKVTDHFGSDKDQKAYVELQTQMTREAGQASVDAMSAAAKEAGEDWFTALKQANDLWVQDATDTAGQVKALYTQALNGINNDLAGLLTSEKKNGQSPWQTFRNNLAGTAQSTGKGLVNDGLKQLEGRGLRALGLATKADGSKNSPFYVILADDAAKAGKGIASLFKKGSDEDGDDESNSSSGGLLQKAGQWLASIFSSGDGGGKALGGAVYPGMSYDVGELGRERFTPMVPGVITPHNALNDGAAHYSISVGNGVTPEQFDMKLRAALQQYHPKAVRASVAAMHDSMRRQPKS